MTVIAVITALALRGLRATGFDDYVVSRQGPDGLDAFEFKWSDGKRYKVVVSGADAPGESIEDRATVNPHTDGVRSGTYNPPSQADFQKMSEFDLRWRISANNHNPFPVSGGRVTGVPPAKKDAPESDA